MSSDKITSNKPWKFWHMSLMALLFGLGSGYLVAWQNLRRMGEEEAAKKFLLFGGVVLIVISLMIYFLPETQTRGFYFIGLLFPVWVYFRNQKGWEQKNPGQTAFSWSIVGWGVLGFVGIIFWYYLLFLLFPPSL